MDRTDYVLTENYCDECDQVLHAVFDRDAFFDHKVGVVECDQCGHKVMPCNECETRSDCDNCPWRNADVSKPMSDEGYLRFLREHEPECYKAVTNDGVYAEVAKRIEAGEKKQSKKKQSKKKPDRSDTEILKDLIDEVMEYNSLRDDEWAFDEEHGNRDSWDAETCDEHDELLADIQEHRKAIRDLIVEATGDEAVPF